MQTDGDEYDEKPVNEKSVPGSRKISRKISSISEIFDSSMMFLKECEWTEVEANEPFSNDFVDNANPNNQSNSQICANSYISNLVEKSKKRKEVLAFESEADSAPISFDFHNDFLFDIKSKCQGFAKSGIDKISEAISSSTLYQKYISPILPVNIYSSQSFQSSYARSDSESVLQKIKKLKIISKNPFMSPLLASDEYLKQMPPVYFVVSFSFYINFYNLITILLIHLQ